ncbi:hypothetical protein BDW75DRAFT_204786 [Aspergillus navahoensis]
MVKIPCVADWKTRIGSMFAVSRWMILCCLTQVWNLLERRRRKSIIQTVCFDLMLCQLRMSL